MLYLLISLLWFSETLTFDFGYSKDNSWYPVNDGVMGGKSQGLVNYTEDVLVFKGDISFQNNGGFASVRSDYAPRDLSAWKSVTIRYRCEGQSLSLGMEHYGRWYLPQYKVVLPETNMKWKETTFNLSEFKEYRVGQATGAYIDQSKLSRIIRFSLMSNDKKEGPFMAEIDFIQFNQ